MLRLFFIFCILFPLTSYSSSQEIEGKRNIKIKKIESDLRVPDDIAFFDENDKKRYFEEFEGKIVLLSFWATWCSPCIQEIQELDALKKDFRKLNIEVIAISQDYHGIKVIKEFYDKYQIRHLSIYHDYKNELFKAMATVGLPTSYILDQDGLVKVIIEGPVSWHDQKIRELILEYIPGNPVMPKNSYKDVSLNQPVKLEVKGVQEDKKSEEDEHQEDKKTEGSEVKKEELNKE